MKTAFCLTFVIFAMTSLKGSFTYPSGPPPSTCFTQYPKHSKDQQSGAPPFQLVLSPKTYSPGQNVTVRVESGAAGRTFKGFQIAVHRVTSSGNAEDFIGTFTVNDANNSMIIDCKETPRSMIAHKNSDAKTSVTTTWTAPSANLGNLQFFLTVVESKEVFWSRIPYALDAASNDTAVVPQVTVPKVTTTPTSSPDWTECGKTKGCWMVAKSGRGNNCSGSDCKVALSYRPLPGSPSAYKFEMAVDGLDKYISVGFSEDTTMGDDQTVTCTAISGFESVQVGYNYPLKFNDKDFTVGVSNLTVGQKDGQSFCSFIRLATLPSKLNVTKQFSLDNPYYILLAWGAIAKGTNVIEKHTESPAVSAAKVNLSAMAVTGYEPSKPTGTGSTVWTPHSFLNIMLGIIVAMIVGQK